MKPIRIFLLLFTLFLFFGLLSLFIPDRNMNIGNGYAFRFPSMKKVFRPEETEYANIASILEQKRSDTDSLVRIVKNDSIPLRDSTAVKLASQPLDYPGNDKSLLHPFFSALESSLKTGEAIHILHYGDSQLEGDRISDYLRSRFQAEFGGSGPGMLPIGEETYRLALLSSVSDNWNHHNLMGTKYKDQGTHPYGPLGSYFRFVPLTRDSSTNNGKPLEAWVTFKERKTAWDRAGQYRRCRIFYENFQQPVKMSIFNGESQIRTDTLVQSRSLKEYELLFNNSPSSLTIRFSGQGSPDFYGICLDTPSGISVDNIAIRGSSGLEFTRMNPALLTEIYRILNVKLMILQFGVNVIPGDLDDYSWYENALYTQLSQIRSLVPDLCIIVIGVSDASRKNGDAYESIPSVEKILKAQKAAAMKANCVFWNLYEAMGGKNSMPSWVFAKEPLATTDFLHFNYAGARIVGKMFYSALINDYNEFVRTNP
ncbi:MAG: hypothetical protein NTU98_05015 [Bacteroidetes bacterium]|nr:hypothetical protein [Bacteroidota bacterium]